MCEVPKPASMKDIQLVLTNPCSENWDDLQDAGAGKYCDRCEKNIVDLTDKSDAELIRFFKKKKDNVCGRLLSSQLNRKLEQPSQKINWQWLMSVAIGASVFSPAMAQKPSQDTTQGDTSFALRSLSTESDVKPGIVRDSISGKVIDVQTGKPLKGVEVRERGFDNVIALTDSTGVFQLDLKKEDIGILLIFSSFGYTAQQTALSENLVIQMATAAPVMVSIGSVSRVALGKEPLYVITAGNKSCTIDASRIKELSPDWIEALEVIKDSKATAIYGAKAANGVVIVEIKASYADKIDFSKQK